MIKNVFKCTKEWLLGEPLVEIKTGTFFVTTFDPKTQDFKKVLYNKDTKKFEIDHEGKEIDLTNAREVAKKVSEVI